MLLVAPDKYKGTLTAREAADTIAKAWGRECIIAPMADGGEGTAEVICQGAEWEPRSVARLIEGFVPSAETPVLGDYFLNVRTCEAVIDSSAVIGLQGVDTSKRDLLSASSAPLGVAVRQLFEDGCTHVTIGIGGTSTCDGGEGFLQALGDYKAYRDKLLGLSDVQVPLLAPVGQPSALMFAPQKGATEEMLPLLAEKLVAVEWKYGKAHTPFDGAGGGLGYAMASVIGCPVVPGAQYVLDGYDIDWEQIDLIFTGEGRYDSQTLRGKVVQVVREEGRRRGIPVLVFAGCVAPCCESPDVIDCSAQLKIKN